LALGAFAASRATVGGGSAVSILPKRQRGFDPSETARTNARLGHIRAARTRVDLVHDPRSASRVIVWTLTKTA
jgi:hypothetical protein